MNAIPVAPEQRELSLLGLLKKPDYVHPNVIASFGDDEAKAVKRSIQWAWENRRIRNMTKSSAAEHVGMKAPHFTNMLNGKKYLPPQNLNAYEWVMGNTAVSQTLERFRRVREEHCALELARAIVAGQRA